MALAPSAQAAEPVLDRANVVVNEQTGRCLDSDTDGNVYTKECRSDNPYQQWVPSDRSGSTRVRLRNVQTGLCLTAVNSTSVRTMVCASNGYYPMEWGLVDKSGMQVLENGNSPTIPVVLDSDKDGKVYLRPATEHNRYQSWLFYLA
ncbi:RICIN domain-containing protein [Streptomyces sp. WELS2]|uniref:RICIN domain-containing protein n=1 Tax=Streptomyces sp. WELS2 TaxID=2749435 RepID=UPI0015F02F91|nr:RICIN domain-containing protein [Streptomyces sp. WELS2]